MRIETLDRHSPDPLSSQLYLDFGFKYTNDTNDETEVPVDFGFVKKQALPVA